MPHKCQNRFFFLLKVYSCGLWGFRMLCFVVFSSKLPLCALWGSSRLDDIGLLLWMGAFLGAPFLYGPSGFRRAHLACPGRTPNWNLQWHDKECWAWMWALGSVELTWASVRPAFLWLPPDSLKEMKRFIGSEEESGQKRAWGERGSCRAQVPLWCLRTRGMFCWPSEVCASHSHPLSAASRCLSLPLSHLMGSHLGAFSLEPIISLFWETWNQPENNHFGTLNGTGVLVLCFWSTF